MSGLERFRCIVLGIYLEFLGTQSAVVCLKRFSRVIDEQFDDISREAAFAALWTCLLMGQPLRQTTRGRGRDSCFFCEATEAHGLTMCSEKYAHLEDSDNVVQLIT